MSTTDEIFLWLALGTLCFGAMLWKLPYLGSNIARAADADMMQKIIIDYLIFLIAGPLSVLMILVRYQKRQAERGRENKHKQ